MNDTAAAAQEREVLAQVPRRLFIDGAWAESSTGDTLQVQDPATNATIAVIADAGPDDGIRALDAAVAAQHSWAATPPRTRGEVLRGAWQLLQDRADELALLITLEMGKPLTEAHAEVTYGSEFLRWFGEEAVRVTGRYGTNPEGTGRALVTERPVGPCFFITPWNFPLAMATRKIAPALAAGCTVVLKPAELTPLTSLYLASVFEEAGLPPGVLNVITTSASAAVSAPIIADPRLRKLSFTGSTSVGVALLKQAADNVLRTSMELGGNAPFLVFEDADLDAAVHGAMVAKFRNIGQACTAANRFLVHVSIAEEFTARLVRHVRGLVPGRGTEPDTTIGPLIDARAVTKIGQLVEDAVARGGRVLHGGAALDRPGNFFAPTVLTDVPIEADIAREEIFGPVVSVIPFSSEAEAVASANATEYGLVGYAYTQDLERAQRLIETLETGMLGLNAGAVSNAAAPFGGVKQSGLGREGGREGIHEYLETKYVMTPDPFG